MKSRILNRALILLFLSCACNSFVQAQQAVFKNCQQPFAEKFDEFEFKDFKVVQERIAIFVDKLNETAESEGQIYVYAGRRTKINQAENLTKQISDLINQTFKLSSNKLWATNGGFRETATIELVLKPLACSDFLQTIPSLDVEEIEFEGFSTSTEAVRKSLDETMLSVIEKTEPVCPPVAKAIGLSGGSVNVYVLINQNGSAVYAKGISGHPLLRGAAAQSVQKWKFKSAQQKNKSINTVGEVTVEFPSCRTSNGFE